MGVCLTCDSSIEPFMSFGRMPIANGFLLEEDFADEFIFELQVGFCRRCFMVQLTRVVDPGKLFHGSYAYFSSISVRMAEHFRRFAEEVQRVHLTSEDPFVVEIGSNDGIMLQHFASRGLRHVGIEPSSNVAQAAMLKGVNTTCRFFDEATAADIVGQYGLADVILGANVVCHLPEIRSVMRGVEVLLKKQGFFIFEEPYLGDVVEKVSYDQIYDEHVFYFTASSLRNLLAQYDMEIVDVVPQNVHGGSMRYITARRGVAQPSEAVAERFAREAALGLTQEETFMRFRERVLKSRDDLTSLLNRLRQEEKRVVGYGATSKSTTVTNFCGIGPDLLEYISDTSPTKQGKYSPGAHIPVVPYERFRARYPDYALLFAWNHAEEIIPKEEAFRASGGKFILYVPTVGVMA